MKNLCNIPPIEPRIPPRPLCIQIQQLIHPRQAIALQILLIIHISLALFRRRHANPTRAIPVRTNDIHDVSKRMPNGAQLPV